MQSKVALQFSYLIMINVIEYSDVIKAYIFLLLLL